MILNDFAALERPAHFHEAIAHGIVMFATDATVVFGKSEHIGRAARNLIEREHRRFPFNSMFAERFQQYCMPAVIPTTDMHDFRPVATLPEGFRWADRG